MNTKKKPISRRRMETVAVKLTAEEKEVVSKLAYDAGMTVGGYVRWLLFETMK